MLFVGEDQLITGLKVQTIEHGRDTVGDTVGQAQVGRSYTAKIGDSLSRCLETLVMARMVHEHGWPMSGNVLRLLNETFRHGLCRRGDSARIEVQVFLYNGYAGSNLVCIHCAVSCSRSDEAVAELGHGGAVLV
jgi:hypothetical protein